MRMRSAKARLILFVAAILTAASCANPKNEAATAQALNDAANEIGGLKSDLAQMQMDVDSLKTIVAKHDTMLTKIQAGVPR
jgi:archaellum component FlaG (FlaF/FlaG flagellin family)